MKSLSRVQLLATPWTAAHQAPPSMGFSRQEYWRGVPLPSAPYYYISQKRYANVSVFNGEGNGTPLQYSCLENPMDGGAWWAAVHGVAKSRARLSDFTFTFSLSCIGEGNGNPLQCSYLENPRDREAWWAAVYGIAQSQTRLT